MAKRQYGRGASTAIHEMAEGLHDIGVIDKRTMRELDASCTEPVPEYTGQRIREIREREIATPAVFARYLGVSENVVRDWEQGDQKPSGPTRRLLSIIERRGLATLGS